MYIGYILKMQESERTNVNTQNNTHTKTPYTSYSKYIPEGKSTCYDIVIHFVGLNVTKYNRN